jgi:hypothetical protein
MILASLSVSKLYACETRAHSAFIGAAPSKRISHPSLGPPSSFVLFDLLKKFMIGLLGVDSGVGDEN